MKIYISYSRQDETLLAEFIKQLDAATNVGAALEHWYDKDGQDGIQPGDHRCGGGRLYSEYADPNGCDRSTPQSGRRHCVVDRSGRENTLTLDDARVALQNAVMAPVARATYCLPSTA